MNWILARKFKLQAIELDFGANILIATYQIGFRRENSNCKLFNWIFVEKFKLPVAIELDFGTKIQIASSY